MSSNDAAIGTALDRDTVRSTSKLLIGALAVVGVLAVVTMLPGVERLVPFAPVTFAAVATAVVALAVAGILLYAAPKFALLTRLALAGADAEGDARSDRIVENAGGVVHWLVVFGAVLVAYRGLGGVAVPVLSGAAWAYDAAFLFVALVPVVFLVARLTVTVDPLAELVADRVAGDDPAGGDSAANQGSVGADDTADESGGSTSAGTAETDEMSETTETDDSS
ncbi:hypothetical protein C463_07177 [Halorubrum californiense DSM 19288]|uniref:Uncharacterized protein n=1 Tax=Halorubrum californiense DSM 19288 TaxID=1227465 RepID=M0ECE4_9EURY|nr:MULTISPECIES: hypothetical protein [Halorubrum]ELZ44718.1 hypothetical protein C463_07177 [Halorubrum californiense DSM 19288]TKX71677.1 hypothetical protein EXE40_07700 [Halorubrum sp. GN11GM_10-3_MGM]